MLSSIKKLLTFIGFFRRFKYKKTKIVDVYSADTNKLTEAGGPYKVKVTIHD